MKYALYGLLSIVITNA